MKILFVCKSLPPEAIGGIQTHTWKLSGWLSKMGHEVHILTAGNWRKPAHEELRKSRHIVRIPYFPGRKLPFFSLFAEEWAFNRAASGWLAENSARFDIVHVQGRSGFTFSGKQQKTPLVATFHGLVSVENARAGRTKNVSLDVRLHEAWASFFEKKTMRCADACIAVSREMEAEMQLILPKNSSKTVILPNGVDVPETLSPVAPNAGQFVFVGRLDAIKGIFPLLEAMKLAAPGTHLTVIGDGPERPEFEKKIAENGLSGRVKLLGAQPEKVVFAEIERAQALILPSFHETQGIVLLEANACARPVIATDIAGIREVVRQGETGWMVEPNNPKALAEAMNWLVENPAEAAKMGENGRAHVSEKFGWEKIALETERFYGRVLATKNREKTVHIEKAAPGFEPSFSSFF